MKTWIFSDSHRRHGFLNYPYDADLAVFCGDASISKDPYTNSNEVLDFLEWFNSIPIKHKVFVPGNHDTSIEAGLIRQDNPDETGPFGDVRLLVHGAISIGNKRIFGSAYTPEFGHNWAYNVPRGELFKFWKDIPEGLDLLVTHGPPKGILDLTQYDTRTGANGSNFFQCGCAELLHTVRMKSPRFHAFGHIHSEFNCLNAGTMKVQGMETTFMNASVTNLNYDHINDGMVIEL